jgi:tripartite-type tricarboxylate transporter receptor subunit TctC
VLPAVAPQLPSGINMVPNNVTGAGGARGANQLYHAKPDGYTISIMNMPGTILMQSQGMLGFDPASLTWLANMGKDVYGLCVPKDSPLKTVDDLMKLAKQRKIKFTGDGPGGTAYTASHICAHLMGFDIEVISGYKGSSDYVVGAVRGDGDCTVTAMTTLQPFIDSGMLRLLVSFEEHSPIPGVADATTLKLPELTNLVLFRMVAGPPKLPDDIADKLSGILVKAISDPKVQDWAKKAHANMIASDRAETAKLYKQQADFIASVKQYIK